MGVPLAPLVDEAAGRGSVSNKISAAASPARDTRLIQIFKNYSLLCSGFTDVLSRSGIFRPQHLLNPARILLGDGRLDGGGVDEAVVVSASVVDRGEGGLEV